MAFRRSNRTTAHSETTAPEQTLLDLVNGLRDLTERPDTVERRFDIVGDSTAGDVRRIGGLGPDERSQ